MNNLKKFGAIALILGIALSSCKKKEEDDNTGVLALLYAATAKSSVCETAGQSVALTTASSISVTSVCTPTAGTGKHYRIEGLEISAGNIFYFNIGNASSETVTTVAPTGNVAQLYFYPGFGVYAVRYAPNNTAGSPTNTRLSIPGISTAVSATSTATVCFDVNEAAPSRVTVWVNGVNSADCANPTTLTAATSVANKSDWNSTSKLDSRNAFIAFATGGQSNGTSKFSKIYVSSSLAIQD